MKRTGAHYFDFTRQMTFGDLGKAVFIKSYSYRLQDVLGNWEDMIDPVNKSKIELKTESYGLNTGNLFIEFYSIEEERKMGGPWRAAEIGADTYIHFFPKAKIAYKFDTKELVALLESLPISKFKKVSIYNKKYTTIGYAVPRQFLHGVMETIKLEIDDSDLDYKKLISQCK